MLARPISDLFCADAAISDSIVAVGKSYVTSTHIICGFLSRIMIGDFWRGTDFQRQILGIKGIDVDNPQMISLEPDP